MVHLGARARAYLKHIVPRCKEALRQHAIAFGGGYDESIAALPSTSVFFSFRPLRYVAGFRECCWYLIAPAYLRRKAIVRSLAAE